MEAFHKSLHAARLQQPTRWEWRTPLLELSLRISLASGLIWFGYVLSVMPRFLGTCVGVTCVVLTALVAVAAKQPRWPERLRLLALLAFFFGIGGSGLAAVPPGPPIALTLALLPLYATLYRGTRAGIVAGACVLALYFAAAYGWHTHALPMKPAVIDVAFDRIRYWARAGLGQALGMTALVAVTSYVVHHANRALERAEESEEKFSKAFLASPIATSISDLSNGRFIEVNPAFEQVFEGARAEILGKTSKELAFWDDAEDRKRLVELLDRDGYVRDFRGTGRTLSGRKRVFLAFAERVTIGGTPCLVLAVRDVTDAERAEAQLRASEAHVQRINAELEQRVLERTQQLSAANAELESFSYSVSHDLKGPLRSIDGFSKALAEDYAEKLDAEGRDRLSKLRAASRRMSELIDDMLRLSRTTRSEMKREPLDLAELARDVARGLRERELERNVEFVCEAPLRTDADPALTRILLENLLDNAWKYTRRCARARIELGVRNESASARTFFVRDNGAGFDMRYAGKLFVPFQRLHSRDEFEGIGIGLATVRRIALRHGGHAWAESAPDQGTTIFFTLGGSAPS